MFSEEFEEIVNYLLQKGYSLNSANYYGSKVYAEWFGKSREKYTNTERIWAYSRGYLAEVAKILSLNNKNYSDFINSEDYYLLDPIDPITKRLVDGKLTIHYTIGGAYPQYMPKYYAWINEFGKIVHIDDEIEDDLSLEGYLGLLLGKVGVVALKPLAGAGGAGFLKLEKKGSVFLANNEQIDGINSIVPLINDKYVITEYIKQCEEFNAIWSESANTLRVITINDGTKRTSFVSYARFGTVVSKGACNLTSGGVGAPFDWETGRFHGEYYRYIDYCDNGVFTLERHPDSGMSLKNKVVPYFSEVRQLVEDISKYLSVHRYFGFDIIITDNGPKICEINSHPSMDYEQLMFGGIWSRNDAVSTFYNKMLCEKRKTADKLDLLQFLLKLSNKF